VSSHAERFVTVTGRALAPLQFRGKGRIAWRLARVVAAVSPEAQCRPAPGTSMTVTLRDRIQAQMWAGAYQPECAALLRRVLGAGQVVLDVGAHVGYFSVLAAGCVGDSGQVHGFESDPRCFAALQRNAAALPQLTVSNVAVSDQARRVSLFRTPHADEWGWSAFVAPPDERRESLEIPAITLDDWEAETHPGRVDAIKISAQGAEPLVLAGAQAMLERHHPIVMVGGDRRLLERFGFAATEVIDLLARTHYAAARVVSPSGRDSGFLFAVPAADAGRFEDLAGSRAVLRQVL
jgi:FkbM family methyltransferase